MYTIQETKVHVRWMIGRDMSEVLAIEKKSFEKPWYEEDFRQHLRQRNTIGMVAEDERERNIGYMVYALHKYAIEIIKLAVHPEHRKRQVGKAMIDKLKSKLSIQRRKRLIVDIDERNLDGQLFLQREGFRATAVLLNTAEYRMEYSL